MTQVPKPLRVAILHYACYPVVGGVESIMTTHARLLKEAGHSPYIIAGRGDPALAGLEGVIIPELDSRHPEILEVQRALLAGEYHSETAFMEWVDRICQLLQGALVGADACIVHNAFTLHKNLPLTVALATLAEQRSATKRWIAWCHDLAWNNPLYREELLPKWPWSILSTQVPNVLYVAISEQRRAEMADLFGVPEDSIALIHNGIDPEAFIPCSPEMAALRKEVEWDQRDWVFLAPVRITRRKNLQLAIKITGAIRDKGRKPLLVITGPPGPHNVRSHEYRNELLQLRESLKLQREVVFLAIEGGDGAGVDVSDALMSELYGWCDALLSTSEQEGFGLPLLEAGLLRVPVFCSDLPVFREVGGPNVTYFDLEEPPDSIANTIINKLSDPGPSAMRRKVLADYSWDNIFNSRLIPILRE